MNKKLKNIAAIASVSTALALSIIKIVAGIITGSLAIISSMIENLSDVFASSITYIAIRFSNMPPSTTYRYGYGKVEALSALIQSAFITGSALFIMYQGVERFINQQPIKAGALGISVMIISLIATLALITFQKYVYKKTNSQAIKADSAHYTVDVLSNIAILISLIISQTFEITWVDPIAAISIAIYLLLNAYDILKDAIRMLLDKELNKEIIINIKKIILSHEFVKGLHDLRTRDLGNGYFFEFHLELDGGISLSKAHEYTEIVENSIKKQYFGSQILIHQEPFGIIEKRLDDKIRKISKIRQKKKA